MHNHVHLNDLSVINTHTNTHTFTEKITSYQIKWCQNILYLALQMDKMSTALISHLCIISRSQYFCRVQDMCAGGWWQSKHCYQQIFRLGPFTIVNSTPKALLMRRFPDNPFIIYSIFVMTVMKTLLSILFLSLAWIAAFLMSQIHAEQVFKQF